MLITKHVNITKKNGYYFQAPGTEWDGPHLTPQEAAYRAVETLKLEDDGKDGGWGDALTRIAEPGFGEPIRELAEVVESEGWEGIAAGALVAATDPEAEESAAAARELARQWGFAKPSN